jgi:ribulose-5-phosphate 4-epimerase/fuculose-1-phosphate aldolase
MSADTGTSPIATPPAGVAEDEWKARIELAAAFRMAYHFGWNDGINNHITARIPGMPEHFLMNPRGLGWQEVTASSLVRLGFDGSVHSPTGLKPGPAGVNFHGAILKAKPELGCVIHTHTMAGVVVSALEGGLLTLDQGGCLLDGEVGYHAFEGIATEADEGPRIVADLGEHKTLIMRNHGLLSVGRNIGEAFVYMRMLLGACELHERVMATRGAYTEVSRKEIDYTRNHILGRYANRPYGQDEWAMYVRMAHRLDPAFAT